MPQLDAYVFLSQVFWFILSFLVLFNLTASVFLPRVLRDLVVGVTRKESQLSLQHAVSNQDPKFVFFMSNFEKIFQLTPATSGTPLEQTPLELEEEQNERILESFSYMELANSKLISEETK